MTVGKFCNRDVIIANENSTIVEVAKLMRHHHVGDVVIVSTNGGRVKPIGILTDRDIVIELLACDVPLDAVVAGDIMSYELVTAKEWDSICDVLQRMRAKGIRRVPVVNAADELVGILSINDLLELFAEELNLLAKVPFREQLIETATRP
ncbi:MAG: CBS domain-containing protein [Desulfobulbales bacterium]|nr:CBS domain-containing protein [Desulfobulbales bacterium]